MKGLLQHLILTLKLNFRSMQALVYGYLVPIFFLLAFVGLFHGDKDPLIHELGELLTISVLGGACFGMPTSMVSERERGVWRRYRLLPAATGGLIFSTMVARFVIILTAALMQIGLALALGMPGPQHPLQMAIAFVFVCFAFLGMGLVIAMLAETVPAVQALGQAIFLPMIMIGGVGVPLRSLPVWAQHIAAFLPGRYAVEALQACALDTERYHGLHDVKFSLIALTIIGISGCIAGAKMFRWDAGQKLPAGAKGWIVPAMLSWAAVGIVAESRGKAVLYYPPGKQVAKIAETRPATQPTTTIASTEPVAPSTAPAMAAETPPRAPWQSITPEQVKSITYDDLEPDTSTVTPIIAGLDGLDDDTKKRLDDFREKLADWAPGNQEDLPQRVRNLLSVAAVGDVVQDENEAAFPLIVFDKLKSDIPKPDLIKILTWVILNPTEGTVISTVHELGINSDADESQVRERMIAYGTKLLFRLTDKAKP